MSYLEQVLKTTAASKDRRVGMEGVMSALQRAEQRKALLAQRAGAAGPTGPSTLTPPVGARPSPNPVSASTPGGKKVAGGGVDSWIQQALNVLKLDASYAPGIKNMILKESSGNPRAVNNWDSNAKRGTPSKGLMQTIDPTFKAHALPGYDKDVFDPVSNIIAGVRYAQKRYGDQMLKNGGRKDKSGKYKGY